MDSIHKLKRAYRIDQRVIKFWRLYYHSYCFIKIAKTNFFRIPYREFPSWFRRSWKSISFHLIHYSTQYNLSTYSFNLSSILYIKYHRFNLNPYLFTMWNISTSWINLTLWISFKSLTYALIKYRFDCILNSLCEKYIFKRYVKEPEFCLKTLYSLCTKKPSMKFELIKPSILFIVDKIHKENKIGIITKCICIVTGKWIPLPPLKENHLKRI